MTYPADFWILPYLQQMGPGPRHLCNVGSCVSAWYEARRPRRILDGCGGAGGAAHGYASAGFEVWGVDNNPALRDSYLRSARPSSSARTSLTHWLTPRS